MARRELRGVPDPDDPRPVLGLRVVVAAADPLTRAGLEVALRDTGLLADGRAATRDDPPADVVVVAVDGVDELALRRVRHASRDRARALVIVASHLDDDDLLAVVEAGAAAILRRQEVTAEALAAAVREVAAGHAVLAPDLVARLLTRVGDATRRSAAVRPQALSERERDVLRLVADGLTSQDIAARLCYSERTIKGVIHRLMSRFGLRNRAHAVAFALREGLL